MASSENEKKLVNVMATVFESAAENINEDASPDTIEKWDSLHHMNLVLALEEAFGIELTEDQTVEIMNYKLIKLVLQEHGIKFN
jgi:acyl carrier protein